MAKFKVGDKVRAITENYYYTSKSRKWEGVVTRINGNKFSAKTTGGIGCDYIQELISLPVKDFELIESKPTKNQRITALEKEVAELRSLKEKVEYLEQAVQQYFTVPGEHSTVENKPKLKGITIELEKTPNQQRKEIIEKAKLFIEKHGEGFLFDSDKNSICAAKLEKFQDSLGYGACIGYSRCHRDDVFNEHIGKAIALGRALRLNVREFEQAVQPTEVVVGMVCKIKDQLHPYEAKIIDDSYYNNSVRHHVSYAKKYLIQILNDTNAIYGGGE